MKMTRIVAVVGGLLTVGSTALAASETAVRAFEQGRSRELAGDLRAAAASYRASLEEDPTFPEAHIAYGRMIEPQNPPVAFHHYHVALSLLIDRAGETAVPSLPAFRRFLVNKYTQYALPVSDPAVSIRLLQQATVFAPEDPRLHAQLALAYFANKDWERSAGAGELAWALGLRDAQVRANIAAAFLQAGETEAAEKTLSEALEVDQFDAVSVVEGVLQEPQDETIVSFREGLGERRLEEIVSNSTLGRLAQAVRKFQNGDVEGALQLARVAATENPRHSNARIYEGDFAQALGDTAAAREAYRAAAERDAGNIIAALRLGDLAYAEGEWVDATEEYEAVLDRGDVWDRPLADVVLRAARARARSGSISAGLSRIDDWLERYSARTRGGGEPREAFVLRLGKARILEEVERYDDAAASYRALVDAHPLEGEAYVAAFRYFERRGDARAARSILNDGLVRLEDAVRSAPERVKPYIEWAALEAETGDTEAAVKILLDGAKKAENPSELVDALHRFGASGAAEQAARIWRERAEDPTELATATLFWAFLAAESDTHVEEARRAIEAFADGVVPERAYQRVRGYLEYRRGNYRDAIRDLEAALAGPMGAERGLYERIVGLSYAELGNRAKALEHLQAALEHDPLRNADLEDKIRVLRGPTGG